MKKFFSIILLSVFFISCNKYEDGPSISFRSPEKRLTGQWEIKAILFNDLDISLGYFSSKLESYPFSIYSDWSREYFIGISHTNGEIIAKSKLQINDKKNRLTFSLIPEPPYEIISNDIFCTIPALSTINEWKILRLKNDELWISTDFDTNNYELRFTLIADFNDY